MLKHLEACRTRGFSENTVENRLGELASFVRWADTRGLVSPHEVTRPALEAYQRHLFHHRKRDGKPLSFRSQRVKLSAVRMFFRWLTRAHVLLANPASELERHTVFVREGKGRKDRMIPIGARALAWVGKYLEWPGPGWCSGTTTGRCS